MPKATVTIDLPDGWELADTKMRKAKPGEYRWLPTVGKPYRLESASEGECFIVRRIADQYVNVRLRREDAEIVASTWKDITGHNAIYRIAAACREALRERCDRMVCPLSPRNGICACTTRHELTQCTREPGHAGEHGGTAKLCGFKWNTDHISTGWSGERTCTLPAGHAGEHGV